MCICVNCSWVDRCKTYYAVEEQHGANHISTNPDFQGNNPKIHVKVMDLQEEGIGIEWDVRSCGSYVEDEGKWSRLRPGEKVPT